MSHDNIHAITPYKKEVGALMEYPQPGSRNELHSFLGMVNQITAWVKDLQPNIKNLNEITSEKNVFCWREIHTAEFVRCKEMLSNHIALTSFDFNRKKFLQTESSKTGLGYILYQTAEDDKLCNFTG